MKTIEFHPLSPTRFADLESLFGNNGAFCGCWCMWWRLTRKELESNKSAGNRAAMKSLVESGTVPGILAYDDDTVVGWCAVAPRSELDSLNRSPVLTKIDDEPVWSITCFFIAKSHRDRGLMEALIRAAVSYASSLGAQIIEAYPHTEVEEKAAPVTVFSGLPGPFERAGFRVVKRASKAKLIMRIGPDST